MPTSVGDPQRSLFSQKRRRDPISWRRAVVRAGTAGRNPAGPPAPSSTSSSKP